jgi:hypothetical protein
MAIQSQRRILIVTAVISFAFAAFVMAAPILGGSASRAQAQVTSGSGGVSEPAPQAKPYRPMAPQTPPPPLPQPLAGIQTLTPPSVTVRHAPPPPRAIAPLAEPKIRPVTAPAVKPVADLKPPVAKSPAVKTLSPRKKLKFKKKPVAWR